MADQRHRAVTGKVGRPPSGRVTVSTTMRIDPAVLTRLRAAAAERDIGPNVLAERAIVAFLDRLLPIDETLALLDDQPPTETRHQ